MDESDDRISPHVLRRSLDLAPPHASRAPHVILSGTHLMSL